MVRKRKNKATKAEDPSEVGAASGSRSASPSSWLRQSAALSVTATEPSSKLRRLESSPVLHPSDVAPGRQVESASSYSEPPETTHHSPKYHVKPLTLGTYEYTPIGMLRATKSKVSIIGVVIEDVGEARLSRNNDYTVKVCLSDDFVQFDVNVMFFHRKEDQVPANIKKGSVLAVRDIVMGTFNNKLQPKAASMASDWSWSVYDPDSSEIRSSANVQFSVNGISDEEKQCYQALVKKYRDVTAAYASADTSMLAPTHSKGRQHHTLDSIYEKLFFDTIVEVVVPIERRTHPPSILVTDYTQNTDFYRENDRCLASRYKLSYPRDGDDYGYVMCLHLFENDLLKGVRAGEIIRLRNVRCKRNPYGRLEGALGHPNDTGIKVQIISHGDTAKDELLARKAKLIPNIFDTSSESAAKHGANLDTANQSQHKEQNMTEVTNDAASNPQTPARSSQQLDLVPVKRDADTAMLSPHVSSFPTPAQRPLQAVQTNVARDVSVETKASARSLAESKLWLPAPGIAPVDQGPRPLICCKAPSAHTVTTLLDLQTVAKCPSVHKIKGRVHSVEPNKVKDWARLECMTCRRLLPRVERFCTKCDDEDGDSLSYCLRFIVTVQETEKEKHSRMKAAEDSMTQPGDHDAPMIAIIFHGKSSQALLPFVDAKQLFNGDTDPIQRLKRFRDQLLYPGLYSRQLDVTFAVHAYPVVKAGKKSREFAAFKETHVLHDSFDPDTRQDS